MKKTVLLLTATAMCGILGGCGGSQEDADTVNAAPQTANSVMPTGTKKIPFSKSGDLGSGSKASSSAPQQRQGASDVDVK